MFTTSNSVIDEYKIHTSAPGGGCTILHTPINGHKIATSGHGFTVLEGRYKIHTSAPGGGCTIL
jgi:hypothetical protein